MLIQFCLMSPKHLTELFKKVLDRNMFPLVLILLLHMYTNQLHEMKWGIHVSNKLSAQNGVKQGGVLLLSLPHF